MAPLPIPRTLVDRVDEPGHEAWLATLPAVAAAMTEHWALSLGAPFHPGGCTAWVAPARTLDGHGVVLKLARRHTEGRDEAAGLAEWAGSGAVRLLAAAAHGSTDVLLLERCVPGTPLTSRPGPEQDEVVAGLLRRLWREPSDGHSFRPLQQMCDEWADGFEQDCAAGSVTVDPGFAREAVAMLRSLPGTADRRVLLATDLHAGNVLTAMREPWLVIDPKPYLGDPTYDAVQHLLNAGDRLRSDPDALVARMADLAGLDRDRLARWVFARCVLESGHAPDLAAVAGRLTIG